MNSEEFRGTQRSLEEFREVQGSLEEFRVSQRNLEQFREISSNSEKYHLTNCEGMPSIRKFADFNRLTGHLCSKFDIF